MRQSSNKHTIEQIQKTLFDNKLSVDVFKQNIHNYDKILAISTQKDSMIFTLIETLIIQQKFYDYFSSSYVNSLAYQSVKFTQTQILQYGYSIVQQLFASKVLFENDQFILNNILKKSNLDLFLLISISKGYLKNQTVRREKVKTFFVQNFKKNNNAFAGLQRFALFHQFLLEKSSQINSFTLNQIQRQKYKLQLNYFIVFYSVNKDFFPSTLQTDSILFKMMLSLKLDTDQDLNIYQKFQRQYFQQNQYHLVTTCKSVRFLIEFFRNSFNEKVIEFYPQKVFIKMLTKYKSQEVDKILSYSEVGLTWNQQQISSCIGNIFKLGLTPITFTFFKSLIRMWLRNGLYDLILKVSQTYIPKAFIFMKHQKLFDVSFNFLRQFTLGPKNSTIGILNKLLDKLFTFYQKDCPISKKSTIQEFMCLIQTKYEKIATLQDKNYIQLKNLLTKLREDEKAIILKDQQVKQRLKVLEWQEIKVSLFSKSGSENLNKKSAQKQVGEFRGLYNIGNSCYMNSFLQCLYMTIEFRYNILSLSTLALQQNILQKMYQMQSKANQISQKNTSQQNKSLMARQMIRPTAELQRLFAQLMKSKRPSISPITIKNVSSPEFKNTFQQDTIEFGRSFLDIVSRSSVENIFQGQQTNEIICPNCNKSRYKKENFIDIMLTDYDDEEQTKESDSQAKSENEGIKIGKMLRNFFHPQKMQGLTCDYCQVKSTESLKKHYLSKLPNYLILTMKRFCYDIKENKNVKKHYRIDLGQELVKVEGQMYELYGIIVHRGQSANSGHYFAFCKEFKYMQKINPKKQMVEQKQSSINQLKNQSITQNKQGDIQFQPQKMQIQNQVQFQTQKLPQSKLNQIDQQEEQIVKKSDSNRWLCLNDCNVSVFESFNNVRQFLDMNQQDTPYILFYQKLSHIHSPQFQHLKSPVKLRQPLQKFLQKDNNDYAKYLQNRLKGNQNNKQVDWKNFGKVKGFTAYDFFKFTKQDDDQNGGNGFGGSGFGNTPIL